MNKLLSQARTGALGAAAGAGLLLAAGTAGAADPVTIQLKWVTQAQFAGYYVAQDKGFYEEAGLDVTIKPGGPDIAPPQVIAGGGADVIVDRSEEHTSELQSLMRISSAVFCLKKKTT